MKTNRIGVRLDDVLLKKLDTLAVAMKRTRSDAVRILLEKAVKRPLKI